MRKPDRFDPEGTMPEGTMPVDSNLRSTSSGIVSTFVVFYKDHTGTKRVVLRQAEEAVLNLATPKHEIINVVELSEKGNTTPYEIVFHAGKLILRIVPAEPEWRG